jgi:hypothetical protein
VLTAQRQIKFCSKSNAPDLLNIQYINMGMKKLLILFILIGISMCSLYSQTKTINGRVISDELEPMLLVSIMINDTTQVGKTDLNGFFQISLPLSEKKVLFGSVGLDPTTIELGDNCHIVEVVMMLSGTYDFITLKKVDRLRMKRFKKLPELHKEAFEKGIFKTEYACYNYEFKTHYRKKKK